MPEVELDADLRLELTTSTGAVAVAYIRGNGSDLTMEVDRPRVLLDGVERSQIAEVADLLAGLGAAVRVVGPDGQVAALGAGVRSRFGRLVVGSARVRPTWGAAVRLTVSSSLARAALVAGSAVGAAGRKFR